MTRLLTSGFEAQLLGTTAARDPEGMSFTTTGTVTIATATPRSGAAYASMAPSAGNYVQAAITTVLDRTYYWRVAVNINATPSQGAAIMHIRTGAGLVAGVQLTTSKTVQLLDSAGSVVGNSSAAFTTGTWYVIEVKCLVPTAGNGTLAMRVDGATITDDTSASTGNTAATILRQGHLIAGETATTILIDDLGLNDNQGTAQNGWCGLGKIKYLLPISDSAVGSGWLNGAGSTPVWDSANNTPPTGAATPAAGTQAQNATSVGAASNLDLNVTSYSTAGIPGDAPIVLTVGLFRLAGNSTTGTNDGFGRVVSNPADGADTTWIGAFDIVAGVEPTTGWATFATSYVYNPTPTRATSPVLRVIKNTAATRNHMCDLMGLLVEYGASTKAPPPAPRMPRPGPAAMTPNSVFP